MAAVLACGPGAVLSHRSAAVLLGLRNRGGWNRSHVTAPNRRGRSPAGIVAHRDGTLRRRPDDEAGDPLHHGRAHSARLRGVAPVEELARRSAQAEQLRALNRGKVRALSAVAGPPRRRPPPPRPRRSPSRGKRTRSELERMFLRSARAPACRSRRSTSWSRSSDKPLEVDFVWSAARLDRRSRQPRHHDTDTAFHRRPQSRPGMPARRLAGRPLHLGAGRTRTPRPRRDGSAATPARRRA